MSIAGGSEKEAASMVLHTSTIDLLGAGESSSSSLPQKETSNERNKSKTEELYIPKCEELKPNFRVEGDPGGVDISVTTLLSSPVPGHIELFVKGCDPEAEDGGNTSEFYSVQSSDDMKLSLVSWYSEPPEDTCSRQTLDVCCLSNSIKVLRELSKSSSENEKENKSPKGQSRNIIQKEKACVEETNVKNSRRKMQVKSLSPEEPNKCPIKREGQRRSVSLCSRREEQRDGRERGTGGSEKMECSRCSRRSRSGNITPCPSRTPKRVIHSSRDGIQGVGKPIKSILKPPTLGTTMNGSGSDRFSSSVDSLSGSLNTNNNKTEPNSNCTPKTKFQVNYTVSGNYSDTGLKRIEKYATLRLRRGRGVVTAHPLDFDALNGVDEAITSSCISNKEECGGINELMTKSMSFLEKSPATSASVRRQASLRRASPMWEPSGTRTSALRLMKIQEAKAKSNGYGSTHSGSGESLCTAPIPHPNNNKSNVSNPNKEKSCPGRVFNKLACAYTESSKMKRLRQDRGVQTESSIDGPLFSPVRVSPVPSSSSGGGGEDGGVATHQGDELAKWEKLAKRYRSSALRFQFEYERAEERVKDLGRQLQESQMEAKETIEFLQAEKQTLAESLSETENEVKASNRRAEEMRRESASRTASLAQLSEQHKQEALKAQALLNRLEIQSHSAAHSQTKELTESTSQITQLRSRIQALNETLHITYKLPRISHSSPNEVSMNEIEITSSPLYPLITSIANAFASQNPAADNHVEYSSQQKHNGSPLVNGKCMLANERKMSNPGELDSLRRQAKEEVANTDKGIDQVSYLEGISSVAAPSLIKSEIFELEESFINLLYTVKRIAINLNGDLKILGSGEKMQMNGNKEKQEPNEIMNGQNGDQGEKIDAEPLRDLNTGKDGIFNGNGISTSTF